MSDESQDIKTHRPEFDRVAVGAVLLRAVVPFEVGADFIIVQRLEAGCERFAMTFGLQTRVPLPSSAAPARTGAWRLGAAVTTTDTPIVQVDETLQPAHEHRKLCGRKEESRQVRLCDRSMQSSQHRNDVKRRERSLSSRRARLEERGAARPQSECYDR